jgi:hypothetical protein
MGRNFLEPYYLSAVQEIPLLLRNTKFHYQVHKTPPIFPILSQMNPVHHSFLFFQNKFLL